MLKSYRSAGGLGYYCFCCGGDIEPMTRYWKDEEFGVRYHDLEVCRAAPDRLPGTTRRAEMAKAITQEAVDKAVAKAVKAETKRCVAAVKGSVVGDKDARHLTPKAAAIFKNDAIRAIKATPAK